VIANTDSSGNGGTSSPTNSVSPATPTPAPTPIPAPAPAPPQPKQNDATIKPAPQAANAAANAAVASAATPNTPASAVPDVRVESVPEQVFPFLAARSDMSKEMDAADDKLTSEKKLKIVAGSATAASFGASAAYVLWLLRGGSLLSSLLSILPAWQSMDPLPVLDNFESRKRRKKRMNSDLESLESMVDKSNDQAEQASSGNKDSAETDGAKHDSQEIP
jgi:hypothetical protein